MIMSVSTFMIGKGAATPVSDVNFCMFPQMATAAEAAVYQIAPGCAKRHRIGRAGHDRPVRGGEKLL
jgi:hypothetical protein